MKKRKKNKELKKRNRLVKYYIREIERELHKHPYNSNQASNTNIQNVIELQCMYS